MLDAVGAVAATSANDPGEPAAASLDDVPERIRAGCGAELDAGRLPGTPSTVIDFTGPEPVVLREGAGTYPDVDCDPPPRPIGRSSSQSCSDLAPASTIASPSSSCRVSRTLRDGHSAATVTGPGDGSGYTQ